MFYNYTGIDDICYKTRVMMLGSHDALLLVCDFPNVSAGSGEKERKRQEERKI